LRTDGGGRGGQRFAGDVREIDAATLEKITFLDQSRNAAATFRTIPAIGAEGLAIEGFQFGDDAALQAGEKRLEAGGVHAVSRNKNGRLRFPDELPGWWFLLNEFSG
jgi:hypothetical protein